MVWEVACVRSVRGFCLDGDAVLGLPMRLVVSLIIGMVSLGSIVGFMMSVGVVQEPMVVSVSPLLVSIGGNGSGNVTVSVSVADREGRAVKGAMVIVSGLSGAGFGVTNGSGRCVAMLSVVLEEGVGEGFLDVCVSAAGYPRYQEESMVKVVRCFM